VASAAATARLRAAQRAAPMVTGAELLAAARNQTSHQLSGLARKGANRRSWSELVLPPEPLEQLHDLARRLALAATVWQDWGFENTGSRSWGVAALFTGPPGTGKTLAAEVLATELGLDLFAIDLSSVVSKYIGETEKNLEQLFEAAADSSAILFFDEADALFGKRTQVRDAHDRYANIEVSYLLQRMEAYQGIAVLATNLRQNLDEAFTRRLQFIVDFPFPDCDQRERLWTLNLPAAAPVEAALDPRLLADRYPLSGAGIRSVAVAAAFLAAHENVPIGPQHVHRAVMAEYQKMGRVLADTVSDPEPAGR
jgi:SpoVK/Ycf46/Vps4 family AAA+-type ATPase